MKYEKPTVMLSEAAVYEENQAWWVIPLGVAAYFGGMWAWCRSMCAPYGGVRSCSTQYLVNVKAVCAR